MTPRDKVPDRVEFFFSYRSPYAWFASRRLPGLLRDLSVRLEYWPVWEPEPELLERLEGEGVVWDFPRPSRAKRRYIFQDVRRHVRMYRYRFAWPVDRDVRWSLPHVAFLYAQRHGCGLAYHERVYSMRFEEGRNVTRADAVQEALEDAGLDPDLFFAAERDGKFGEDVLACFRRARRAGVAGWPFFTFGRERFWGNDRIEWLVATIRDARGLRAPMGGNGAPCAPDGSDD